MSYEIARKLKTYEYNNDKIDHSTIASCVDHTRTMISSEEAVNTLIAMSRRWASDYSNCCSWVVNTSKFTQAYPTDTRKFKLDTQLVETPVTFTPTEIQ